MLTLYMILVIMGWLNIYAAVYDENHSLFIAFAPMKNSEIAISVVVENAGYGSEWAVPIASLMIEKYLKREVKRKELEQRMIDGNLIQAK